MSFWSSKTLFIINILYIPKKIYEERRTIRLILNGILPTRNTSLICSRRASAFTSKKGSITVEAAMAVPMFFFAIVCLLYLMEIMAVQTAVRSGLQYAGKKASQEAYVTVMCSPSAVKSDVVNAIGADRLEGSIVVGGSGGIDCSASRISPLTGVGELSAKYRIRIPVPVFRIAVLTFEDKLQIKVWNGYEKGGFGIKDEGIVYVTETGLAYHRDYHCTHLDLSIRMVQSEEVKTLRNKSGGIYHACERCGGGAGGGLYITDTGDRYHGSLSCSGLKRTVYAIPLSEATGKRACSKCGK